MLAVALAAALVALAVGGACPALAEEPGDAAATEADADAAPAEVEVTVRVVGPDGSGGESQWASQEVVMPEGQTAWQATTTALSSAGLAYQSLVDASGESLASVTSPLDGTTWAPNASNGDSWRLFVNGSPWTGSADACQPRQGDEILWYYHQTRTYVTISAVGPGGTGEAFWLDPVTVEVAAGESAWDLSLEALEAGGYHDGSTLYYGVDANGDVTLGSLSSLGPNGVTGESWQLFVNGSPAEENVARLTLHDGDDLCWYYANAGDTGLPSFARTAIARAKAAGAHHVDGRVYTAWGRRLASYLPDTGMAGVRPTLRVVGDRVEVGLGDATVTLSCADGSVLSVSEGGEGLTGRGEDLVGRSDLRDLVPLASQEEDSQTWAWGLDGSFYYVEATGVVYRLVVL